MVGGCVGVDDLGRATLTNLSPKLSPRMYKHAKITITKTINS